MAPVLPPQAAVSEVIVYWKASKHSCAPCRYQRSTPGSWATLCQLECTCSTEEAPRSLTWSTAFCGIVMCVLRWETGYTSQTCMEKDWRYHILDKKTKLWLSKMKHQSFLQEHQKVLITDFHRTFSANRTFRTGKIESFCKAIYSNCYTYL